MVERKEMIPSGLAVVDVNIDVFLFSDRNVTISNRDVIRA